MHELYAQGDLLIECIGEKTEEAAGVIMEVRKAQTHRS